MGRDGNHELQCNSIAVSIHTPAWGATEVFDNRFITARFQFTRPRGARHIRRRHGKLKEGFNSHARVGRDIWCRIGSAGAEFQFTRPRGARRFDELGDDIPFCFNSHARVGRDSISNNR